MERPKIAILGAGVVGLSVAPKLLEKYHGIDVTIVSETFLQQTTSYGSGGLWEPYAIAGTPDQELNKWGQIAFEHFRDEYYKSSCDKSGVQLMTAYSLFEEHQDASPPSWKDIVYNFQMLSREDIVRMGLPSKYVKGYTFGTFVVDQKYYLQYITKKLQETGVRFVQRKVNHISELMDDYDCVINCCGLGAYGVVNDKGMYPIRGQVLRVKAPWMKNVWFFGPSYIIPNVDNVVVGGTTQKDNWNTNVSLEDTKTILDRVAEVFPSVAQAPIENIWVGLRPGRAPVRLEATKETNRSGKEVHVIHCYGHGGSGVTLAMGCAKEVVDRHFTSWYESSNQKGKRDGWITFRSKL